MQLKTLFVFLMAVALVLPLATAFNCTKLDGEEQDMCNYIEDTDWSQYEQNRVIREMINSGSFSFDGNFESIMDNPVEDPIQLNKLEESELKISDENKGFLKSLSSISIFGYFIFAFLKKYLILLRLI